MKPGRLWMGTLLGLVVLVCGCGRREAEEEQVEDALPVRVQIVESRAFERRLTIQGAVECRVLAHVSARVAGTLDQIRVDEGDRVTAGETLLFQIDPVRLEQAVAIAEQDLEVARAVLEVARATARMTQAEADKAALDVGRYARLHAQGRVSDHEYESHQVRDVQARASVEVAAANVTLAGRQVAQAESALMIAQKNLLDARVTAPISGVVSRRDAEPGEYMTAGQVVLRVDDFSTREVSAFLPSSYFPDVIPDETRLRLRVNRRDAGIHPVSFKAPTVDPVLRTFEIKGALGEADPAIIPGDLAEVTVVFSTRESPGVPASAVLFRGGDRLVFVVEDGRAVARPVETGLSNDGWVEVLSGLDDGASIVYEGQTQLTDGRRVTVR